MKIGGVQINYLLQEIEENLDLKMFLVDLKLLIGIQIKK